MAKRVGRFGPLPFDQVMDLALYHPELGLLRDRRPGRTPGRLPHQPRGRAPVRRGRRPGPRRVVGGDGPARPVRGGRGRGGHGDAGPHGAAGEAGLREGAALRARRAIGGAAGGARTLPRADPTVVRARPGPPRRRRHRAAEPGRAWVRSSSAWASCRRSTGRWSCSPTSCSTTWPSASSTEASDAGRRCGSGSTARRCASPRCWSRPRTTRCGRSARWPPTPRPGPGSRCRTRRDAGCAARCTSRRPVAGSCASTTRRAPPTWRPAPSKAGCGPTPATTAVGRCSTASASRTSPATCASTSWPGCARRASRSRQADWLAEHGIDELVDEGRRVWSDRAPVADLEALRARSRVSEAEALLDPTGLGAFRVLEWDRADRGCAVRQRSSVCMTAIASRTE